PRRIPGFSDQTSSPGTSKRRSACPGCWLRCRRCWRARRECAHRRRLRPDVEWRSWVYTRPEEEVGMIARFAAALMMAGWSAVVLAQDYPARDIRSICNFAAGSGADIIVRFYSDRLSKLAGKPVIVENKPGAQGTLATDFVAKAKPDGYTLMITPASSTLATAPHLFKKL